MTGADDLLAARARRAYERGRLRAGLAAAAAVLPMAALSWIACGRPAATALGASLLAGVVVAANWRGLDVGRGARIGLVSGLPALLVPVAVGTAGHLCDASVCLLFPTACLLGGVLGGLALGALARRARLEPAGLATAALTAWLGGTLGCLVMGTVGVAVLVAGLAVGAAPALVWKRA
jgi:hypothetical protein